MTTEIQQIIAMYAPTILLIIGTIVNFVKVCSSLKKTSTNIVNDPKMIALKNELDTTKDELAAIKTQLKEMINRQGELVNEMTKVVKYDNG